MKLIINNGRIAAIASTAHVASGMDQAVIDAPDGFDPDRVNEYSWDGSALNGPGVWATLEEYKAERIAEVAQKKWEVETGGLTVEGVFIDTTRESQSMITGAYNFALLNQSTPDWTIDFRASTGWITLTASEMIGIGAAVAAHVQASFTRYRALEESITACTTVAEVAAIDINIGWPG